jgi:predicted Ser/Thr protein kinase
MIGKTFSHYRIDKLLGAGGMGVVYLGLDTRLNRPVAIKFIKPDLTKNADRVARFFQEARAAAAVNHPAIAQVYDVGETDGSTYIVMEYVEGKTVRQLVAGRELDLLGAVEVALQVAEGLGRAHKAHIVHRDIKSDNIMVTAEGHAKILDFGLAKLLDQPLDLVQVGTESSIDQAVTQTIDGHVLGTPSYMSPEQARGQEVSPASDIFSLGIVIFEMVTGELPFKGDTPFETIQAIAFDEARPVTVIRRNLPPELQRILSRCLRKNPKSRYPEAMILAEDLKRLKNEIESGLKTTGLGSLRLPGFLDRLRNVLPFGTVGIVLAGGLLIGALAVVFRGINWSMLIVLGFIGLGVYRKIRNWKSRMLKHFVAKLSKYPGVKAIFVNQEHVTVVVDKAQAAIYLHVNSLIDEANQKRYFGEPLTASVRDDLPPGDLQRLLRQPGVAFVRDDVVLESPPSTV